LRRPKKVPADLRNIFAVRKNFPQACMPFKTSAKSFRSHPHLFRDRKVFCSAAPQREHNSQAEISKLQPNGLKASTIPLKEPLVEPSSHKESY